MLKFFKNYYPQERNQTADLLKGLAVLFMIQVHLMELFAAPKIYQSLIGKVSLFLGGPPAAPLFMAVMGYFLANSNKSFLQNIKRGLILIVGGIILNVGLNFHLLVLIFLEKVQLDPLQYIFGADILPLAGLSIILLSLIKYFTKDNPHSSSLVSLLIIIFILISHSITIETEPQGRTVGYIQAFFFGKLEWSYFPLLPWAVYPLAGFFYGTSLKISNTINKIKNAAIIVFTVITITTFNYAVEIASDLREYYHHNWIYSLWILQFLALMIYAAEILENNYGKSIVFIYIKWLGKNVTVVYVFQWLLIGNIATAIYRTQNEIELVIWFLAVVLITSLVCFGYERLKNS